MTKIKLSLLVLCALAWPAAAAVPDAPTATNMIASGDDATCRIMASSLYCWGSNVGGSVGDGTTTSRSSSNPYGISGVWKSVVTAYRHTCAINNSDELYCWGKNNQGQLGLGDTTDRTSPTRVGTGTWYQVTVGYEHTCGLLKSSPASVDAYGNTDIRCWGNNSEGEFGDTTTTDTTSPTGTFIKAVYISAGHWHTCAIRATSSTQRSIRCTGWNGMGELGINSFTSSTSWVDPRKSDGSTITMNYVTKLDAGNETTCVVGGLTSSATELRCWGYNANGRAGHPSSSQVQYVPMSAKCLPSGGSCTGFTDVSVGYAHTVAIKSGSLVGMGWNGYDQQAKYGSGGGWSDSSDLVFFDEPDGACYNGDCSGLAQYTGYAIGVSAGVNNTLGFYAVTPRLVYAVREYGNVTSGGYPSPPFLQTVIDARGWEY
jgi:alpha-tubulin suppressor-like RCC1 family protein